VSELKDLKRYRVITSPLPISDWGLHERGDGEFVKFSDVEALVAPAKDAACIELLKVQAECWEKVFLHCCDLGMDPYGGGLPIDDVCDFIGLTDSKEVDSE